MKALQIFNGEYSQLYFVLKQTFFLPDKSLKSTQGGAVPKQNCKHKIYYQEQKIIKDYLYTGGKADTSIISLVHYYCLQSKVTIHCIQFEKKIQPMKVIE